MALGLVTLLPDPARCNSSSSSHDGEGINQAAPGALSSSPGFLGAGMKAVIQVISGVILLGMLAGFVVVCLALGLGGQEQ